MDDSIIKEGLVYVHGKGADNKVLFYNPAQVFNRDLSLVVLKTFIVLEKKKIESNPKLGKFIGVNILETLAATGIRGIRYSKELGDLVNLVTLNDLDRGSAEMIVKNANLNEIPRNKFRVTCCDGNFLSYIFTPPPDVTKYFQMAGNIFKIPSGSINGNINILKEFNKTVDSFLKVVSVSNYLSNKDDKDYREREKKETDRKDKETDRKDSREEKEQNEQKDKENNMCNVYRNVVDVVDIDPYSSATGFIDSTVRCVRSGGIVLITSTDMPTLCGNNPLVAFYKYGGTSFKSPFCHELSLRVLLYSIMLTCSRYKRVMEPLLSVSVDFYLRVFVRIKYSPEGCSNVGSNSGLVFMCVRCHSYKIVKLCEDFIYLNIKDIENKNNKEETKEIKINGINKENKKEEMDDEENNKKEEKERDEQETKEIKINGINKENKKEEMDDEENKKEKEKEKETNDKDTKTKEEKIEEEYMRKNKKRKIKRSNVQTNVSKICEECGSRMKMGGPIYIGPLHDRGFVESCLNMNKDIFEENKENHKKEEKENNEETEEKNKIEENNEKKSEEKEDVEEDNYKLSGITMGKRVRGLLTAIKEEIDVPLYYSISDLCQIWNLTTISPILFKQILENMGYKASNFHRDPNSIKTDAPNHVVMDIIRAHARNSGKISNHEFLNKQVDTLGIDFDLKVARVKQVPRWLPNPTSHWGPKKMHKSCSSSIKL